MRFIEYYFQFLSFMLLIENVNTKERINGKWKWGKMKSLVIWSFVIFIFHSLAFSLLLTFPEVLSAIIRFLNFSNIYIFFWCNRFLERENHKYVYFNFLKLNYFVKLLLSSLGLVSSCGRKLHVTKTNLLVDVVFLEEIWPRI